MAKPETPADPLDPIARLVQEAGDDLRLDPPRRLRAGKAWPWQTVTHALLHATRIFEQGEPEGALEYLEKTFPADFDVEPLEPLAREALAEVVNLWAVCFRHGFAFDTAIGLFDTVLDLTQRERIRQFALYNRGFARLQGVTSNPESPPRHRVRALEAAEADFAAASTLDPDDAAAWAQLGTTRLLLGHMTTRRVRKRRASLRGALEAYERTLALETDPGERHTIAHNRATAEARLEALSAGWLERTLAAWSQRRASRSPAPSITHDPQLDRQLALVEQARRLLNVPVAQADDGQRDRDPCSVAQRLVRALGSRPHGAHDGAPLAEAVWFLAARDASVPSVSDPARRALVELTQAAQACDWSAAASLLARCSDAPWQAWLAAHLDGLCGRHLAPELARFCRDTGHAPGGALIETLAALDPPLCLALLAQVESPHDALVLTRCATLAAIDSDADGVDALEARWASLCPDAIEHGEAWAEGELRRLARRDLDEARRFRRELLEWHDESPAAAVAYFARLAREVGDQALVEALGEAPPAAFAVPRVLGCALGGVRHDHAVHVFIEDLHGEGYAPHLLFRHLVELSIRTGQAQTLEATLRRGGAHGWQVAAAASRALRLPEVREDPAHAALLELCLGRYEAGPVAGRDASDGGFHVGQCELCPDWLAFDEPKPLETLVLTAALSDDAPWWGPLERPLP